MEHLNLIYYFVTVFLIGLLAAGLAMAFQWFMHPNMIFYPYMLLLFKISQKGQILTHLSRALGLCRYCNGTWIGIYMYTYFYPFDLRVLFVVSATFMFIYKLSIQFPDIDPFKAICDKYNVDITTIAQTSVKAMLYTYLIIGFIYSCIYLIIPYIFN